MSVILFIARSIAGFGLLSTLFTEFMEVPKGSPQMVIHPEPPLPVGFATQKDGPSTLGWNLKAMLLLATTPPDGRGFDKLTARGCVIDVVTLEQYGYETERVIVEVWPHVRSNPVVQPN